MRFDCSNPNCGRVYHITFGRRGRLANAAAALKWLTECGWVVVGPPAKFYCTEGCQAEAAKEVKALPPKLLPAPMVK